MEKHLPQGKKKERRPALFSFGYLNLFCLSCDASARRKLPRYRSKNAHHRLAGDGTLTRGRAIRTLTGTRSGRRLTPCVCGLVSRDAHHDRRIGKAGQLEGQRQSSCRPHRRITVALRRTIHIRDNGLVAIVDRHRHTGAALRRSSAIISCCDVDMNGTQRQNGCHRAESSRSHVSHLPASHVANAASLRLRKQRDGPGFRSRLAGDPARE